MIPPSAFTIWFQGEDEVPQKFADAIAKNRAAAEASGWTFSVYDEHDLRSAARACGVSQVWDRYHRMHQKIDLGRMCLLYVHGGVSVDADQIFVKPFDQLPGLQSDVPVFSEMVCSPSSALCHRLAGVGAAKAINNALIMSPTRSPEMLLVVRRIASRPIMKTGSAFLDVVTTTGPTSVGWAISDLLEDGRAISIPASVVEPCSMSASTIWDFVTNGQGAVQCSAFPDTVAVHPYSGTWHGGFGDGVSLCCSILLVALLFLVGACRRSF